MLKKRLTPLEVMKALVLCLLIVAVGTVSFSSLQSDTDVESPIAEAEKLILSEKYYEAILGLKPLLISERKSEAQEKALWLAHQLGEKIVEKIEDERSELYRHRAECKTEVEKERMTEFIASQWDAAFEKMRVLNLIGADSGYRSDPISMFYYNEGFLQQLVDRYPESPKRAVAEYYLIFDWLGFPRQETLSLTLKTLHAYIEKYEKTGRAEVYKAYLDIAHIHHGLWAVMTFEGCDDGMASRLDPEDDTKNAEAHKAEAEKYYLKYHLNPHGLPGDEGYERLKNEEEFGYFYIVYGIC